jgi:hypothetical protein
MLDYYRREGLSDVALHWFDVYPDYAVGPGMEEDVAVRKVLATIERFSQDSKAQGEAAEILRHMLNEPIQPALRLCQSQFASAMGRPSAWDIAVEIDKWLKQ